MGRGWRHPQGFQDGWDKKDGEDLANLEQKLGAGMSREPGEPGVGCGFSLAPNSHPLSVSLPGHTQPSQPDGSDPPGPPPKAHGTPAGHAVPFLWRFLARWLQSLVHHLLCAGVPPGEECEFVGAASPFPHAPAFPGARGEPQDR